MRLVTKEELLKLEPPVMFRRWVPCAYDEDWEIKTGKDFGAIELSPDPDKWYESDTSEKLSKENVYDTWDWDGNIDVEDNEAFVVAEPNDIKLMMARLQLCLDNNDNNLSKVGVNPLFYDDLKELHPNMKFKGWVY